MTNNNVIFHHLDPDGKFFLSLNAALLTVLPTSEKPDQVNNMRVMVVFIIKINGTTKKLFALLSSLFPVSIGFIT